MHIDTFILIGDDFFNIVNYQGEYSSEDPDYAEGAIDWKVKHLKVLSQEEWGSVELMWGQLVWGLNSLEPGKSFEVSFSGRKLVFEWKGHLISVAAGVQYPEAVSLNFADFMETFATSALEFYTNLARIKNTDINQYEEIRICHQLQEKVLKTA